MYMCPWIITQEDREDLLTYSLKTQEMQMMHFTTSTEPVSMDANSRSSLPEGTESRPPRWGAKSDHGDHHTGDMMTMTAVAGVVGEGQGQEAQGDHGHDHQGGGGRSAVPEADRTSGREACLPNAAGWQMKISSKHKSKLTRSRSYSRSMSRGKSPGSRSRSRSPGNKWFLLPSLHIIIDRSTSYCLLCELPNRALNDCRIATRLICTYQHATQ